MDALRLLADHVDRVAVLDPRIDHDGLTRLEAVDTGPDRLDDPRSVGAEDAWLRNRRQPLPDPDVQVVQRCSPHPDENLARTRLRIGHVLVAEHLRSAVLVNDDRLHPAIV